jgi:hypothetical protein
MPRKLVRFYLTASTGRYTDALIGNPALFLFSHGLLDTLCGETIKNPSANVLSVLGSASPAIRLRRWRIP